jgi:molybdate transport system substrate-binding protein
LSPVSVSSDTCHRIKVESVGLIEMPTHLRRSATPHLFASRLVLLCAVVVALTSGSCIKAGDDEGLLIAAASSLRDVIPALATEYQRLEPDQKILVTYAGSGVLARQIEEGAPIDLAILAGSDHADHLIAEGHADGLTRGIVATNRMVLVSPQGTRALMFSDLGELEPNQRIAIGNPTTVPAGRYARDLLMSLNQWEKLLGKLIYTEDVTAALTYVKRSQAAAAIVYTTELRGVDSVLVGEAATGVGAPRPEVVMVLTGKRANLRAPALKFRNFLFTEKAQQIFAEYGFGKSDF